MDGDQDCGIPGSSGCDQLSDLAQLLTPEKGKCDPRYGEETGLDGFLGG